ncbi:RNA-binding protein [Halocynthiibacter sp. C4]|uniref:RNA-binding protein n=1 Tax=Halocynthiibacter sp. C4 TaxID=2992758 RepID=UPI00237B5C4A|nr:RNA-binding protein [Halocynthiibacter sp. C4]MDE0590958.1 RNA-binding protein [Halocynthiibacter sp. C4]
MARGGRKNERENPERRCIATGETRDKSEMIRFVIGPENTVFADVAGKLPGRGIWVTADRAALEKAANKGLFSKAAKQAVKVPDTLVDDTEAALARRVVDYISLARKAGRAITGYEKVKGWLETEQAKVLFQASDGSERGKSKLRPPRDRDLYIDMLTASELGLAFGRENVIHGALASGGLTDSAVEDAKRLRGVRANGGGTSTEKGTKTT